VPSWSDELSGEEPVPRFTADEQEHYCELKAQGLEKVLGKMHGLVGHAIIPFQVGGPVDMYRFPNAIDGTAFATMELIEPDGSGPQPSSIGTYELVAFTKCRIDDEANEIAFDKIELRLRHIFTEVARYSYETQLNPLDTLETSGWDDGPSCCVILDEYTKPDVDFVIGHCRHSLLLLIEVFHSEMEYAMQHGSQETLAELKRQGYYPYSDMDREPLF
jgi:hypothetical protein